MATATRLTLDFRKPGPVKAAARQKYIAEADKLLRKQSFTREDSARVASMLELLKIIGDDVPEAIEFSERMDESFRHYLRTGVVSDEFRDMGIATQAGGGALAPVGFANRVISAMKAVDRLVDPDVITVAESDNGYEWHYPLSDDTTATAAILADGNQATEQDPNLGELKFALADQWVTPLVKLSNQLFQDSGINLDQFLAVIFGIRLARGIGAKNVSVMIADATLGATAAGSSSNDGSGSNGTNTIGTDDLCSLMASVDNSYISSSSCGWAMNWKTLISIFKIKDKQGRPVIKPILNEDGDYLLYGKPVFLSPSMADIGTGNKPIAFGDFSYIVQRMVKNGMIVDVIRERYVEYLQTAYRCWQRANSGFAKPATESPVKYLQNA